MSLSSVRKLALKKGSYNIPTGTGKARWMDEARTQESGKHGGTMKI